MAAARSALRRATRAFCTSTPGSAVYGGVRVPFTTSLTVTRPEDSPVRDAYRVLTESGAQLSDPELPSELCLDIYRTMVRLETLENIMHDTQRQGRISFFMASYGEEGAVVGSAAGLAADDPIFAQYRECGVLMWRGFTLQNFTDQCFSNIGDPCKGRQMPIHYGSRALHFQTISSPLSTQLPQATGAAYAMKMAGEERCVTVYFGDGAASMGDFHPALNFAATLECPMIFFCRNNGYAISTPTREQYRGDGIISRAAGYGMLSIRVDGNDALATLLATRKAREIALSESRPVLIEAMSYRQGHHSTSDDSTRYREVDEIEHWRSTSHPISRLRSYLETNGWWSDEHEESLRQTERNNVLQALTNAETKEKPAVLEDLFSDVYAEMPVALQQQRKELEETIAKYPNYYVVDH